MTAEVTEIAIIKIDINTFSDKRIEALLPGLLFCPYFLAIQRNQNAGAYLAAVFFKTI
jgi:hypothetical protein